MSYALQKNFFRISMYALIIASGALLLTQTARAGLGVSPGVVYVQGMLPGTEVTREVSFMRGDPVEDQMLRITLEGAVADHVSAPTEMLLPKGVQEVVVPITIAAGSLPTGSYEVFLTGKAQPIALDNTSGAGSTIAIAVRATIKFEVSSDARQEYKITSTALIPAEENQPLGMVFQVENTGNTDAQPSKIVVKIVDVSDASNVVEYIINGADIPPVKAFTYEEVASEIQAPLKAGKYTVDISIFDDKNKMVFEKKDVFYQVHVAGTLDQKGELVAFAVDKNEYKPSELISYVAQFRNSGSIGVNAELVINVTRNGERVEVLKGEKLFIPPGKLADISLEHRLADNGKYIAIGFVHFGIFDSNKIEQPFTVNALPAWLIPVVIAVAILALLIIVWMLLKRRRGTQPPSISSQISPPSIPSSAVNQVVMGTQPVGESTISVNTLQQQPTVVSPTTANSQPVESPQMQHVDQPPQSSQA